MNTLAYRPVWDGQVAVLHCALPLLPHFPQTTGRKQEESSYRRCPSVFQFRLIKAFMTWLAHWYPAGHDDKVNPLTHHFFCTGSHFSQCRAPCSPAAGADCKWCFVAPGNPVKSKNNACRCLCDLIFKKKKKGQEVVIPRVKGRGKTCTLMQSLPLRKLSQWMSQNPVERRPHSQTHLET